MKSEKLWTKNFVFITLSGLFSATVFYIFLVTMAEYAASEFGAGTSMAGFVASIFVIGSVLGRLFTGEFFERLGRKRMIFTSSTMFLLCSCLYLLPMNLWTMLILRFVHGIGFGMINNMLATIVVDFIPWSRLGEGISCFSLNFVIATAAGPFVGMFIVQKYSYEVLFVICIALAVIALLLLLVVDIKPSPHSEKPSARNEEPSGIKNLFEKKALPLAFLIFIMGMCYTSGATCLQQYSAESRMSYFAPFFFVIYGAFILIFRPQAGKLLDRKGDNFVMIPSIICYAISLAILSMANNVLLYILSAFFMALGFGNILNIGQTIVTKSVDHHRIGKAISTYFVFNDSGYGFGPVIMGAIAARGSFSLMYMGEAILVFMCLFLYYGVHGRFRK